MHLISTFIRPGDVRWTQFLEQVPHDVYHRPGYLECTGQHEGGQPVAFYAEEGDALFLVPLLLRPLPAHLKAPSSWLDATTPYGYPGPLVSSRATPDQLHRFLRAFREAARDQQLVSVFFRLHPLLVFPHDVLDQHGTRTHHGETVYLDLTCPLDLVRQGYRRDHRMGIRKLERAGFTSRIDDWDLFERFMDMYQETMHRVGASAFYQFDRSYFFDLKAGLGADLHLFTVHTPSGEVAASGLFTATNDVVQFHLSGTTEAYRRMAPSKLMIDQAMAWAHGEGIPYLHLGGGLGAASDSLFLFKAGFSRLRVPFYTYRMMIDSDRYAHLCRDHRATDYFPAYRQPVDSPT